MRYKDLYSIQHHVLCENLSKLQYRGDEVLLPKPKNEYRIVCIGGSTTYTEKVDDYTKSYPDLLERILKEEGFTNVEVVNAGAGSWSSWESLINFELRVLDLNPDLVIIYHSINDIHPRLVWPKEAYKGDNSGRRSPNVTSKVYTSSIFEHSTFFRILLIRFGFLKPQAAFTRTIDRAPNTYYGGKFRDQMRNGTYPSGIFEKVSAEKMLKINKPIYFQRNIENIIAIAKYRGIEIILATFAFSENFRDQPRVSSEEYINAFKEQNNILRKIAAENNVLSFDFANIFPKDKIYFVDGRHVNEKGVKLKAKLFADFLITNEIIK